MSKPVGLVGLHTVGGALLQSGPNTSFFAGSGKLLSTVDHKVDPHSNHGTTQMVQGSKDFFISGKPACRVGDQASCGDSIDSGSKDFFI